MTLKKFELVGFKSFGRKETLFFGAPITAIVGPNGSGKSNVAEAFRWVLGEQSLKSLRGKRGEDLIFNGSVALGRLSRASASITFNNELRASGSRLFSAIDFDEVTISREVFRDGAGEYKVNGTSVRLRDVLELLAGISLDASGHHIISQGEADRVLSASAAERRAMIEDALGLKIHQWKLAESEKKLAKTEDNIKQTESIRREIAPHLKFLKKQVEKIEQVRRLKEELRERYREYLKREEVYLEQAREKLAGEVARPRAELVAVEKQLSAHQPSSEGQAQIIAAENEAREIESRLRAARVKTDELARALGRLEGLLEGQRQGAKQVARGVKLPLAEVERWVDELDQQLAQMEAVGDLGQLKTRLAESRRQLKVWLAQYESKAVLSHDLEAETNKLQLDYAELKDRLAALQQDEMIEQSALADSRERIVRLRQTAQTAERDYYEWRAKQNELKSKLAALSARQETLDLAERQFKTELGEAAVLLDRSILSYDEVRIDLAEALAEDRSKQEERRHRVERLKIKLEDLGGESSEVAREYDEVMTRDAFLAGELADLAQSREALQAVMTELRAKIEVEFLAGLAKINQEFQKFFVVLFGGGSAGLELLKSEKKKRSADLSIASPDETLDLAGGGSEAEEEEGKTGIEVNINLPRKKVRGLAMLSGGERALTSIALLFAMSQVNPPPFLILDETDAALDEANSRKYGDMIESLSRYSQLILITHNRETMSRAGVLYGVTMGSDSVSRLISVKFDEATQYAK